MQEMHSAFLPQGKGTPAPLGAHPLKDDITTASGVVPGVHRLLKDIDEPLCHLVESLNSLTQNPKR